MFPIPPFLTAIFAFFGRVPKWVWYVIGAIALITAAYFWHQHAIKKHDAKVRADVIAEIKDQEAKLIKQAKVLKDNAEKLQHTANQKIGEAHDAAITDIHARADDLRLHTTPQGGAIAASRNDPNLPRPSTGGLAATGAFTVGPDQDLAAVPRLPLINAGESCDLDRASLKAWQDWYPKQKQIWDDWLAQSLKGRSHQ